MKSNLLSLRTEKHMPEKNDVYNEWQIQTKLVHKGLNRIGSWMMAESYHKIDARDLTAMSHLQEMLTKVNKFLTQATWEREEMI